MKKEITLGEKIAKEIINKVNKSYRLYKRYDISTEELNEKEWKEREIRRVVDSIKYNLINIK